MLLKTASMILTPFIKLNINFTAHIDIHAVSGLAYEYTLSIDGKSLKKFVENKEKTTKAWTLKLSGVDSRIVLG